MSTGPSPFEVCTVCGSERIPGIGHCANCGQQWPSKGLLVGLSVDVPDEPLPDRYTKPTVDMATCARALNEARALEYAGDTTTAIAIYERLTRTRTVVAMPYQRLAILYRKAKQWQDEERVVRLALAHIPSGPNSWFVLRLAKILGERQK